MMDLLSTVFNLSKKIVAPPFCLHCRIFINEYTIFCDTCIALIKPIPSMGIQLYNTQITIHALSEYNDPLKSLILAKQSSDYTASVQMAQLIWKKSIFSSLNFDIIIPVPLHWTRFAHRGFNQSEVIAQQLSKMSGKPMVKCVYRAKKTVFQAMTKNIEERKQNVQAAFRLTSDSINYKNKKILIIDDLYTTGSTIKEMVRVLMPLEPSSLQAFVVCRGQ